MDRRGPALMRLVIDNSVVAAWILTERDGYADAVLDAIGDLELVAPAIWPLEMANVLAVAERRGRISAAESSRLRDLDLAIQLGAPVATSDGRLRAAAARRGVVVFQG